MRAYGTMAGALAVLVACTAAPEPAVEPAEPALELAGGHGFEAAPDLVGVIRELTPDGGLVVGAAGAQRVRIDYRTVLQLAGGVAAHRGDLAEGRRIRLWLDPGSGDPPIVRAARVLIEDDESEG